MKLLLTSIINKQTAKNNLPYMELTFKYPERDKTVKYCVWSFVHNKENGLQQVWNKALAAKIGTLYNMHFQKATIQGQLQFVITCLDAIDDYNINI